MDRTNLIEKIEVTDIMYPENNFSDAIVEWNMDFKDFAPDEYKEVAKEMPGLLKEFSEAKVQTDISTYGHMNCYGSVGYGCAFKDIDVSDKDKNILKLKILDFIKNQRVEIAKDTSDKMQDFLKYVNNFFIPYEQYCNTELNMDKETEIERD